jgi:hypothetical protein
VLWQPIKVSVERKHLTLNADVDSYHSVTQLLARKKGGDAHFAVGIE